MPKGETSRPFDKKTKSKKGLRANSPFKSGRKSIANIDSEHREGLRQMKGGIERTLSKIPGYGTISNMIGQEPRKVTRLRDSIYPKDKK